MSDVQISHVQRSHVQMSHVQMSHAQMSHVQMSHVKMSHVHMSHVEISHVQMSHVQMSHVRYHMFWCQMFRFNMCRCHIFRCHMFRCHMLWCNMFRCQCIQNLSLTFLNDAIWKISNICWERSQNALLTLAKKVKVYLAESRSVGSHCVGSLLYLSRIFLAALQANTKIMFTLSTVHCKTNEHFCKKKLYILITWACKVYCKLLDLDYSMVFQPVHVLKKTIRHMKSDLMNCQMTFIWQRVIR
jgi:hypothetical protein